MCTTGRFKGTVVNRALLPVHGLSREMTLSVPLTQKYRAMFAILAIVYNTILATVYNTILAIVYNTEVTNYVTVMNKHIIPHHILIQGDPQRTRLQRRLNRIYVCFLIFKILCNLKLGSFVAMSINRS